MDGLSGCADMKDGLFGCIDGKDGLSGCTDGKDRVVTDSEEVSFLESRCESDVDDEFSIGNIDVDGVFGTQSVKEEVELTSPKKKKRRKTKKGVI